MLTEKILDAVSAIAWPLVVLILFLKTWPTLKPLVTSRRLSIKVAGIELGVAEATENIGRQVADLQQKIVEMEQEKSGDYASGRQRKGLLESVSEINEGTVIWVDDFPSNNAFLIDKLRRQNIGVVVSVSTEDALIKMSSKKYSVLITDLGRIENGMNNPFAGLHLVEKLRASGDKIPILVFGGERAVKEQHKLLAAGADAVSASGTDVLEFVERHLSKRTA